MSIKITMSETQFVDEIRNDQYANWSVDGARLLFEYLDDLSDAMGDDFEFDPVWLRCTFDEYKFEDWGGTQHSTILNAAQEYGWEVDADDDQLPTEQALEFLEDRTMVILGVSTMIIEQF